MECQNSKANLKNEERKTREFLHDILKKKIQRILTHGFQRRVSNSCLVVTRVVTCRVVCLFSESSSHVQRSKGTASCRAHGDIDVDVGIESNNLIYNTIIR